MEYKFTKNDNFEDFSSGRVLYHIGGEPTFPVRLTLEIYERCLEYSNKKTDITLYDCCCGGAYMLTILGLLKNNTISRLFGSDIDTKSIRLAEDNLGLLTASGLNKRKNELEALYQLYGKSSHQDALCSIDRIKTLLAKEITAGVFHQNAFKFNNLSFIPDIIMTDVPYGNLVEWNEGLGGINEMLISISKVCGPETILCICMDKKQKIQTDLFERLEKQMIGKRKFEIYKKKITK